MKRIAIPLLCIFVLMAADSRAQRDERRYLTAPMDYSPGQVDSDTKDGDPAQDGTGISSSGVQVLGRIESAFEQLARSVGPSVVAIQAERIVAGPSDADEEGDHTQTTLSTIPVRSTGSGVIISRDGLILTNEHVVSGRMEKLMVTMHDRRRFEATVVGADSRSDLAVLRIPADNLQPAVLGDARQVRPGQFAIVMGNPFGLAVDGQAAMTVGVVSAVGRSLPERTDAKDRDYGHLIQTTADINPGNSGGPLFNIRGQVMGITTIISTTSGYSEGVGFAVPMDGVIKRVIDKLSRGESIRYGFLGARVKDYPNTPDSVEGPNPQRGAEVDQVLSGSPAALADLRVGDVITHVDDQEVRNKDELVRVIGVCAPGDTVTLRLLRNDSTISIQVTLADRKEYVS